MAGIIIAIDGPVGSGKSTIARRVAELLGYTCLDTGAMYRAIALKALRSRTPLDSPEKLEALARNSRFDLQPKPGGLHILLDGSDVTTAIRAPEISKAASMVAAVSGVRRILVAIQHKMGANGGIVMEGRDIGTVVFPDAQLKIYLDASPEIRAARRLADHLRRGESLDLPHMLEEIHERDRRDTSRPDSPLRRAPDAVYVDNSALGVDETARLIALLARKTGT